MTDPTPPICMHCDRSATPTTGETIYPHRPDLHAKHIWECRPCRAYVGCHGDTRKPLGRPANAELRHARMRLHNDVLDPLWKGAADGPEYEPEDAKARAIITRTARRRVYDWLGDQLGISRDDTHTALFDLERCREAYRLLRSTTYPKIRAWAKARKEAA